MSSNWHLQIGALGGIDEFTLVLLVAAFFLIWYLTGSLYNRKLLRGYGSTLGRILEERGVKPRYHETGSRNLVVSGRNFDENLAEFALGLSLIGRENPFILVTSKFTKRGDLLTVRANLAEPPRLDFELLSENYFLTHSLRENAFRNWSCEEWKETGFVACWKDKYLGPGPTWLDALKGMRSFWRLSFRKESPHLLANLPASLLLRSDPSQWLKDLSRFTRKFLKEQEGAF